MLNNFNRWINYYDIIVTSYPEEAPYIPLGESLEYLYVRQQAGESVKLINNETAALRIADMAIDKKNNIASLLIQYSDQNASDPVFSNLKTGHLRQEPKLQGEGIAISAHLLISLTPSDRDNSSYLALLEAVPGVTQSKITPFLRSELKEACEWEFTDKKKKTKNCRPIPELRGYMAQSLKEGLKKGRLLGLELVQYSKKGAEFDMQGFTSEQKRQVFIKPSTVLTGKPALDTINKIKDMAKGLDYDEIRINFKNEGKQKTVECSTNEKDAADALYTKSTLIKVQEALPQCLKELRSDIVPQIKKLIIADRAKK